METGTEGYNGRSYILKGKGTKLIDQSDFKRGYDACVLAGGFRFPPPPDHRAQNALLKQQLTNWDKDFDCCGEFNSQDMPHGRVIIIAHGYSITLAHFRNGKREGTSLYIGQGGEC